MSKGNIDKQICVMCGVSYSIGEWEDIYYEKYKEDFNSKNIKHTQTS